MITCPAFAYAGSLAQQSVSERIHTGYEVQGIHAGGLLLKPSAKLLELFNDNIYATKSNTKSDLITVATPKLEVTTLNPKRGFTADIASEHGLYNRFSGENYNDIKAGFRPFIRMTPAMHLDGKLAFERNHDTRSAEASSNNIGAEEPVRWTRSTGRLGWEYKPGRIGMSLFAQQALLRYENVADKNGGVPFINEDRDRNETEIVGRLSCDLTDQNSVYLTAKGFNRDYKRSDFDRVSASYSGNKRNSNGAEARIGSTIQLTPLVNFDINGGYYFQQFDSNTFSNVQTIIGQAKAKWQVTPLTSIDVFLKRNVFETIQPDASSFVQNHVGASVDHELKRNIILGFQAGAGSNHYNGSTRQDDYWGVGPSVTYRLNRNLDLKADYLYDRRSSNLPIGDYSRNRVYAGIQVKF